MASIYSKIFKKITKLQLVATIVHWNMPTILVVLVDQGIASEFKLLKGMDKIDFHAFFILSVDSKVYKQISKKKYFLLDIF